MLLASDSIHSICLARYMLFASPSVWHTCGSVKNGLRQDYEIFIIR